MGLRISRDEKHGTICLDQEDYVEEILHKFGMDCMEESKPVHTPEDPNQKLSKEQCPSSDAEREEMRKVSYREAVGSLIYASQGTRPDISHAVNMVSRFSNDPGRAHWNAVKRIFRYLRGTTDTRLQFSRDGNHTIEGYGDADWANETDKRRSVTGSIFLFQGGPISWQSKKQGTTALSTTEAKYMALSSTCQEALWLESLA
ncbi:uncharacterized protein [Temnothorax longispinosus]|uniref:uncharacterized protein n=1 Tax=Temnothorax longispinosus TaxID=300112 RepID=UPI003A9A4A3F